MIWENINDDLSIEFDGDMLIIDIGEPQCAGFIETKEEADEFIEFIKKHYDKLRDE